MVLYYFDKLKGIYYIYYNIISLLDTISKVVNCNLEFKINVIVIFKKDSEQF